MGYVFTLNGAPVSWKSQKQKSMSTSTTHSEYVGMSAAAKQGIFLRDILWELFDGRGLLPGTEQLMYCPQELEVVVELNGDYEGAIALAGGNQGLGRLKHIETHAHWLRELVRENRLKAQHVPTTQMVADGLTKALGMRPTRDFLRLWKRSVHPNT
ncbi:hypothetical protein BROUX41_005941 [Berkeleyomyces rouxiae]